MRRYIILLGVLAALLAVGWWFLGRDENGYYEERIQARPKYVALRPTAWVSPDQRTVLIRSIGGDCDNEVKVKVRESPDTVKIAITVRAASGPCTLAGNVRGYKVVLHQPLRNRKLVDIDDVTYDRTNVRPVQRSGADLDSAPVPMAVEYE